MKRSWAKVRWRPLWGAALAAALAAAARPADAAESVTLELVNREPAERVECVLLLAHFFTLEAGSMAPDEGLTLTLERQGTDLALRNREGVAMLVENLICGLSRDWSASRAEVPLAALRSGPGAAFRYACAGNPRLACRRLDGAD